MVYRDAKIVPHVGGLAVTSHSPAVSWWPTARIGELVTPARDQRTVADFHPGRPCDSGRFVTPSGAVGRDRPSAAGVRADEIVECRHVVLRHRRSAGAKSRDQDAGGLAGGIDVAQLRHGG
jgi:hypothetical protein